MRVLNVQFLRMVEAGSGQDEGCRYSKRLGFLKSQPYLKL